MTETSLVSIMILEIYVPKFGRSQTLGSSPIEPLKLVEL